LEGLLSRARTDQRRAELEAELSGPPLPSAAWYLWRWFQELHCQRGATGFGPAALTYPDLLAWSTLTARTPAPWEVEVLCALDRCWREVQAEKAD